MIEFGLWSNNTIEDMPEHYRRWYRFLSPEDIACFMEKVRYYGNEDYQ